MRDFNLKIGLEIHQQLDTGKLFCRCPCIIKDENPDFKIKRFLRTSASELGEIDQAALHEYKKGKHFIYESYSDVNCLIEIDEEPPKELNHHALNITLQVSLLLNARPVDQIQFMRKIVIDGSNVSGFQRTALIATNGYIETSEGKINIPTICLEEESAKKIEDTEEYRIYNLSRLGIPLIEIATSPDIKSPEGAKEAAEKLGMVLRSVKGLRRGLGSIRQDINLSVKNTSRVEIKGFQDLRSIPKVAEYEIQRRLKIIESGKTPEAEVRKAEPDLTTSFLRPMPGAQRMYVETDVPVIKITKKLLDSLELPIILDKQIESLEEKYKLNPDLAREIIKEEVPFENFVKEYKKIEPNTIAQILVEIPKEIKSRLKLDPTKLKESDFNQLFELIQTNKISKSLALDVLVEIINTGKIDLSKYETISLEELEKGIKNIIEKNKGASFGALMGEAMKLYKGKSDPKLISELVKKYSQ
ncbi:Glu-tRNA(Gln) amidotransferase subunit GatE [Candidatus Woesearchaeota archaeon]|nr:Glu-tRNA(Gln) amidotransferase subunit GatE [Candidatus Woesearchaeota archaeon]